VAAGLDLRGKNVIVTGGYSGIGRETARVLALHGAFVFVVGRDMPKGEHEAILLRAETGNPNITAMQVDLSSLASIRNFADEFTRLDIPIHVLINNAGVMCCPKGKTVDGFETHFGTNHVGHFYLTNLLIPRLLQGAPARVVNVSAAALYLSGIHWNDIHFDKRCYGEWQAYAQSKTANVLFATELNRRYKDQGIISNALHPGVLRTNLQRHGIYTWNFIGALPKLLKGTKLGKFKEKTLGQGTATSVFCAVHPAAEGGKMYSDCKEGPTPAYATDPEDAQRLWDVTTRMIDDRVNKRI